MKKIRVILSSDATEVYNDLKRKATSSKTEKNDIFLDNKED